MTDKKTELNEAQIRTLVITQISAILFPAAFVGTTSAIIGHNWNVPGIAIFLLVASGYTGRSLMAFLESFMVKVLK